MVNAYTATGSFGHACNCIGPQNGDPLCPCQMRSVVRRDGRYVQERDLGPIKTVPRIFTETPEMRVERLRRELADAEQVLLIERERGE